MKKISFSRKKYLNLKQKLKKFKNKDSWKKQNKL